MDTEEPAINVFIDNQRTLRNLMLDLPRGYFYPKPDSKGIRELNRDARLALRQFELTINQGIDSGVIRSVHGLNNAVMVFLNDAWLLMRLLYAMRNRGEVSRRTWRRALQLHRWLWHSVGNPPHNEF